VGKRRVVLVNGKGDVAEGEIASAGWNLQNGVGLFKVCSAAVAEDLEIYSTNPGVYQLLGADGKKLFQLKLNNESPTHSFEREELTKLHLDSLFPSVEPGQVPSVIALSELKGFGPKSASKKMQKFANVNQLLEEVLKSVQKKPAKLNVAISESRETLVRRSVRVNQPKLLALLGTEVGKWKPVFQYASGASVSLPLGYQYGARALETVNERSQQVEPEADPHAKRR